MEIIIIGGNKIEKYIGVIRDQHGEVEVNLDFAWANPHIYHWVGATNVGNERTYYFEYYGQ